MTCQTKPWGPEKALYFSDPQAWSAWLEQNHANEDAIWLKIRRAKSQALGICLEDAVMEALCYGWIDGLLRRLDQDFFLLRFSPRKPGSTWSKINRERAIRLIGEGRMKEAGLARVEDAKASGWWEMAYTSKEVPACPKDLRDALKRVPNAADTFDSWTASERSKWIFWVVQSKSPETRARRIREIMDRVANSKGIGFHNKNTDDK